MISAIVLTKNNEDHIEKCLRSLSFCREIIIIDDFSNDKTLFKCQTLSKKCRIYQRRLDNNFAAQRNYGLSKVKNKWVLFVDSDEIVSASLKTEIISLLQNKKLDFDGYYLKREDVFLGKKLKHGETGKLYLLRLAKKEKGLWQRPVHEIWQIKGKIGVLKNPLIHYPHNRLEEFLQKINFYSTLNAYYLFSLKQGVCLFGLIGYPTAKFLFNFFYKKGFLDGLPGFIHAVLMSLHSFLTRAKLYLLYYGEKKS